MFTKHKNSVLACSKNLNKAVQAEKNEKFPRKNLRFRPEEGLLRGIEALRESIFGIRDFDVKDGLDFLEGLTGDIDLDCESGMKRPLGFSVLDPTKQKSQYKATEKSERRETRT